jgi:bifunctional UDP-N-acetylglucosamine pyrophosphorylase/glucosamine-1-phosphate N-acetyltransferase
VIRRAIVLAAGEGKRMRSTLPKVLHPICGRSMVWFVLQALRQAGVEDIALIVSPRVAAVLDVKSLGSVKLVTQTVARGTGDAVRVALEELPVNNDGHILIANGDMPLLDADLFTQMLQALEGGSAMSLGTARMGPNSSFGRIERNAQNGVSRIIEVRDAQPNELALQEMNVGLYAFNEAALRRVMPKITCENAQNEYYLTDAVALLNQEQAHIAAIEIADTNRVLGVNDRVEQAFAQAAMNRRLCEQHMRNGVTIIDPATTYLEPLLIIGSDTTLAPNTRLSGATSIGEGSYIGPNSRLVNAQIGARTEICESVVIDSKIGDECRVGPFAHLRMGSVVANDVRIGNFVELKKTELHQGVRAGHLSYLGDAEVGTSTNIGAGTITCNYDGNQKHRTVIGKDAFIGSNSSLIAPIHIGDGALTGAGSVVTKDVADAGRVVGNPARPLKPAVLPVQTGSSAAAT